jgi:hypothetical protein
MRYHLVDNEGGMALVVPFYIQIMGKITNKKPVTVTNGCPLL